MVHISISADGEYAVLMDPDYPRALGPVAVGEHGAQLLGAFLGAFDHDPSGLPPWELERHWSDFLQTAAEYAPPPGEHETPAEPPPADQPEPTPATQPDAAPDTPPDGLPPAPEVAPPPGPPETPAEPPEMPEQETSAPTGALALCPTCDGEGVTGTFPNQVECEACAGTGKVRRPAVSAA